MGGLALTDQEVYPEHFRFTCCVWPLGDRGHLGSLEAGSVQGGGLWGGRFTPTLDGAVTRLEMEMDWPLLPPSP